MSLEHVVLKSRFPDKQLTVVLEDFKKAINHLVDVENDRSPAITTAHDVLVQHYDCYWKPSDNAADIYRPTGYVTIGGESQKTDKLRVIGGLGIYDSAAAPYLRLTNASDTARDPVLQFAVGATPVVKYTMGVDDSYGDDLTLCAGSALVETYAAGLLVDVYADKRWIDVYPSVEVYGSLYAGDPNGSALASYCSLQSVTALNVVMATLDISHSGAGYVDIHAYGAGGSEGYIELDANACVIETAGDTAGGDFVSLSASSGGLLALSTGVSGDDIAWIDMESANDSSTGRAYIYFDATDYYFDGTTFNLGRGGATSRHAQFNFINHAGGANYNYVGLQAPDTVAASFTLTLPATDSTGTQALVSNGSGALSWSSFLTSASGIISNPPSTGYTIKNIYLNASKHIVVVYDSTPIP